MDVISTITSVVRLINEILKIAKKIEKNRAELNVLTERLQFISSILERAASYGTLDDFQQSGIARLEALLSKISNFIEGILKTQERDKVGMVVSVFNQVRKRDSIEEAIKDYNADLDRARSDLHFLFSLVGASAHGGVPADRSLELEFQFSKDPEPEDSDDERAVLGEGSYGKVYKMKSKLDDRLYAVKQISTRKVNSAGLDMLSLRSEIDLLCQLSHRHIVRYYISFYSKTNKYFNLAMELVVGGTLADQIHIPNNNRLCETNIVAWMQQSFSALAYMHDMRILHRDIKPENMLLDHRNHVKIADFGLGCVMGSQSFVSSKAGAVDYMSLEKANRWRYDGRDDVWGMGCVLVELLTNRRLSSYGGSLCTFESNEEVRLRRLDVLADARLTSPGLASLAERMLSSFEHRVTSAQVDAEFVMGKSTGMSPGLALSSATFSDNGVSVPDITDAQREAMERQREQDKADKLAATLAQELAAKTLREEQKAAKIAEAVADQQERDVRLARERAELRAAQLAEAEAAQKLAEAAAAHANDWRCNACFMLNPTTEMLCTNCHETRPTQNTARALSRVAPVAALFPPAVAVPVPTRTQTPVDDDQDDTLEKDGDITDSESEETGLCCAIGKSFHPGKYRGLFSPQWSCCEQRKKSADGCECPDKNCIKMLFTPEQASRWKRSNGWTRINLPLSQWEGVQLNWVGDVKCIALSDNYVSGRLPTLFYMLPKLVEIRLDNNMITGPLSDEFCRAVHLKRLILNGNQLSGNLPDGIVNLSYLKVLNLQSNNFRGCLNPCIGALRRLRELRLGNNNFTELPITIALLENLVHLDVSFNNIRGEIPPQLSALFLLQHLNLANNKLTGAVPASFGHLKSLVHLNISNNGLVGDCPSSLAILHDLTTVILFNNEFSEESVTHWKSFLSQCQVQTYVGLSR